jgi:hypothetical protein
MVRTKPWTRTEIRPNGNQPVRRCRSSCLDSLSYPSDFHSNLAECPTDTSLLFCRQLSRFSIPMIQLQQGAAYSDNLRDVSEATFEADAVAVVIWNMHRMKREGFARCSKRSTSTPPKPRVVGRRLVTPRAEPPARRSRSVCWSRAHRLRDDRRRVTRKRPARTALNFHTIGEA